jgi:hypothetical protein
MSEKRSFLFLYRGKKGRDTKNTRKLPPEPAKTEIRGWLRGIGPVSVSHRDVGRRLRAAAGPGFRGIY